MSTVEHQLREYFDAGVERISVDDVMAQAAVREERLEPLQTQRSLKPAWAAVGAFVATIALIGGVVTLLATAQHLTGKVEVDALAIVDGGGGAAGVWLVAAIAAALVAATLTWLIRRPSERASREEPDQGKVMVMKTIEQPDTDAGTTKQQNRWPTIVIAVLAVAVVGLVAWMVFAMRPNSPNAAPADVVELMEEYTAAWNAYDADALEAVVTPTYRIRSAQLGEDTGLEGIRTELFPYLESIEWHNPIDGPYYAVGGPNRWFVSTEGSGIEGTAFSDDVQWQNGVINVVEFEGELHVAEHFFYAED
jgi:hypothetical protein